MDGAPPPAEADRTAMEEAIQARSTEHYVLCLYVSGTTVLSSRAIVNTRKLCEEHLAGRYDLEVVDILRNPKLAAGEQIVAVPTLIKKSPAPSRRFIGDMSQTDRLLLGLDLRSSETTSHNHV